MLLIVTNRYDLTTDWLVLELERRGVPYVRFNTEDFPATCGVAWDADGSARLRIGERDVDLSEVDSVWYRRPAPPTQTMDLSPQDGRWAAREAAATLDGLWATLDARWVSHPSAIRGAASKLRQLRDAARLGFDVPRTEVTNEPDGLRALWERSPHGVVCKALSDGIVRGDAPGALLYTSRVTAGMIDRLGPEPHLFQELVPKTCDIRVTVIGSELFATRIDSQADAATHVDWRQGGLPAHHVAELPDELAERCLSLVAGYDLVFAAIDLAQRGDGGYTFFELNPNGQWAWIEQHTGVPLRSCLADLLLAP